MIKTFKLFESFKKQIVIDWHDVPKDIHGAIRDIARDRGYHNNSYLEYEVWDHAKPIVEVKDPKNILITFDDEYVYERGDDIIVDWLIDNGANENDCVLFKIWW